MLHKFILHFSFISLTCHIHVTYVSQFFLLHFMSLSLAWHLHSSTSFLQFTFVSPLFHLCFTCVLHVFCLQLILAYQLPFIWLSLLFHFIWLKFHCWFTVFSLVFHLCFTCCVSLVFHLHFTCLTLLPYHLHLICISIAFNLNFTVVSIWLPFAFHLYLEILSPVFKLHLRSEFYQHLTCIWHECHQHVTYIQPSFPLDFTCASSVFHLHIALA